MSGNQSKLYRLPYSQRFDPFRIWDNLRVSTSSKLRVSTSSTKQTLSHPEGRTAATDRNGDDEWSDGNMRRWEEADKLDPVLAEWLEAQRGN